MLAWRMTRLPSRGLGRASINEFQVVGSRGINTILVFKLLIATRIWLPGYPGTPGTCNSPAGRKWGSHPWENPYQH
eukprot:2964770-Rhodomonas_salina.1